MAQTTCLVETAMLHHLMEFDCFCIAEDEAAGVFEVKRRFPTTNTREADTSLGRRWSNILVESLCTGSLFPAFTSVSHMSAATHSI